MRGKCWGWLVAIVMTVGFVAQGALPPVPTRVIASDAIARGFNVDAIGLDDAARAALFARIGETRFGWIRQQVRWSAAEPAKGMYDPAYFGQLDALVVTASAYQVHVLLTPVHSPGWVGANGGLPPNAADYGDFLRFLATRYRGKIAAYEIWNEPNHAIETGGHVDVAAYLPVLRAGYTTLKAVDPAVTVLFAGLVGKNKSNPAVAVNDLDYLTAFYALNGGEGKRYYDVMGAHPGSACNPPDASYPDSPATTPCGADADGSRSYTKNNAFYFKRFLETRAVMERHGEGGKPIWLTEFGWDSAPNPPTSNKYARYVSEDEQARYLTRALTIGGSYPWLGGMFVWNLNFQATNPPTDEKYGWSILRPDGSPRPAFIALRDAR